MLKKILKYDLKWHYPLLVVFYFLAVFFGIITRIFLELGSQATIYQILGQIGIAITISVICSLIINNIIRVFVRLIRNCYKDESYLTHTLPIKKRTIYLSKILASIITMSTSMIVICITLAICFYSKENIKGLSGLMTTISYENDLITPLIVSSIVVVFLQMICLLIIGNTSIIIGYRSNNKKTLKSFIYGLGMYLIMQIVALIIIFLTGFFKKEVMEMYTSTSSVALNTVLFVINTVICIYAIAIIIYYLIGKKQFEIGVNVD